ncbi:MAG: hypothetical protein Q8T08_07560 [Ignavibacteria bacterium]|nr:hypothetical protein [Ignavibacteria bacterium]
MKNIGIIIIILGFILTAFTTFTFFTKEKVVDLGNVEITRQKEHSYNIHPLIGIAVMGIGGIILWQTGKKQ